MKKDPQKASIFKNLPVRRVSTRRPAKIRGAHCSSPTPKTARRYGFTPTCQLPSNSKINVIHQSKETIMEVSPYGLQSLWDQGDIITRGVAVLLVAMSIASWYVILTKAIQLLRLNSAASA